jgi:hypothetical protein
LNRFRLDGDIMCLCDSKTITLNGERFSEVSYFRASARIAYVVCDARCAGGAGRRVDES